MARTTRRQASRRKPPPQESTPLPGWVWGVAGLSIGLFAALLIYLETQRSSDDVPPQARVEQAPPAAPQTESRHRFEFYTLLPELEVVVPEPRVDPPSAPGGQPPPPSRVEEPGEYILQAGSFRGSQDADRMRASLAMLGVEASIRQVEVNNDTWHRVQVGPFSDLDQLNRIRDRLHDNQIQTMMMRKPGSG
ncbi:sporulation protein [Ectothiorhodospira haloalkaliphila]|uniref:Sporulation protein n=1 Tax=Ectothiorhodospira haloalkaliphila TaxID=421628 RepID=W8KUQ5_9GAMM|nr:MULTISPECIES: SPOR domain-containing protein [Ectothiorhodospira]AHK79301.1 sporulation protein [Ectothiorhodospira haloalkaliphila]MCG5495207.1 SPOR domain-containing protein [Ectothiorhodospira variabilis]MCG5504243.1 SPOR domain-containing protein [Ectothiorhodospira variabilis]MCG5507398.1 SPOR domain-containing protein [Ectothiorhodospira variabilis]MCG5525656.1 SPOR domain-containing protein [Ectothiorhodospira haloalkaliphila]